MSRLRFVCIEAAGPSRFARGWKPGDRELPFLAGYN
jgi:hypothetical protein